MDLNLHSEQDGGASWCRVPPRGNRSGRHTCSTRSSPPPIPQKSHWAFTAGLSSECVVA